MTIKCLKRLKPFLKKEKKIVFFADFETTLYENQHYVTCFVLSSPDLKEQDSLVLNYSSDCIIQTASKDLVISFIKKCIFYTKKSGVKESIFYFHNLGKFDGFFILNYLSFLPELAVKVISRDNVLYEIKIVFDNVEVKFRDSFLLFPLSLDKIAVLFNEKKDFFAGISAPFKEYGNNEFRALLSKYCENDVKILQKAILWYQNYIMNRYKIDIYDCLTLPSIAFKIYRTHFYLDSVICQSHGFMDSFIRKSYRGGVVDVYKPILENGYYYDVNSLYPYVMSINDMPVGPGTYIKLDCTKSFDINNFFGFVSVKVKSPKNIYIPFLTVTHKQRGLISPVGEWIDTYFSEEIKYAKSLGYEFEYYACYKFDRKVVFNDYVTNIYKDRIENKDKPSLSDISKLLLNSLYGRFGMSNSVYKNILLKNTEKDQDLFKKINLIYDAKVVSILKGINDNDETDVSLIRYNEVPNLDHILDLYHRGILCDSIYNDFLKEPKKKTDDLNISVHIASAITAYARIYMHKIKMEYKDHLYYSDTDSLILDKELSPCLVSEYKIGLFKLEHKITRGIFIAPKLYYMDLSFTNIKKSKGIDSNLLSYEDFMCLYYENCITVTTLNKFVRNLKNYTITASEKELKLQGSLSKRIKVYNITGTWSDTKPLLFSETL